MGKYTDLGTSHKLKKKIQNALSIALSLNSRSCWKSRETLRKTEKPLGVPKQYKLTREAC